MTLALSVLGFLFLFYLPGQLLLALVGGRELAARRVAPVEGVFAAVVSSLFLTTSVTFTLAVMGEFSTARLFQVVAAFAIPMALALAVRRIRPWPWTAGWESVAVAALLGSLAFTYLPTSEFVFGGHDKGTYVNAAVHISRTGGLQFEDELLQHLTPNQRLLHSETYLPGFYFADVVQREKIVSHGFHFHPAFLTALVSVGGLALALAGPCILALLSVWAAYLIASRLAGPAAGVLVALLIGLSPMTVWFSRQPVAEGMAEALLLSASALLLLGWRGSSSERGFDRWASSLLVVSGCVLGALHLTKVEFVAIPGVVLGFAFVAWSLGRRNEATLFVTGYTAVLGVAIVSALTTHQVYSLSVFRVYGDFNGRLAVASVAFLPLLGAVLLLFRRPLGAALQRPGAARVLLAACALTLLVTGAVFWMGPTPFPVHSALDSEFDWGLPDKPEWMPAKLFLACRNLQGLSYYTSVPGLFLGVLGVFLLLRKSAALPLAPMLVIGLVQTAFYSYVTTPSIGHITSHRRFLVVSLPVLVFGAVLPWLMNGAGGLRSRLARVAGIVVAAYLGVHFLTASWPQLGNRPWPDTRSTLQAIADEAPENVVWLGSSQDALALRYLVPLRFLANQETFLINEKSDLTRTLPAVLGTLKEMGFAPVVLVGEETPQAAWIRTNSGLFEPTPSTVIPIVEPTVVGRYLRLPGAEDFVSWHHELELYPAR